MPAPNVPAADELGLTFLTEIPCHTTGTGLISRATFFQTYFPTSTHRTFQHKKWTARTFIVQIEWEFSVHLCNVLEMEILCKSNNLGRGQLKCDDTRAETRFRLSAKRTSPFKSAGGVSSVDYWQLEACASAVVMLDTPCPEVV